MHSEEPKDAVGAADDVREGTINMVAVVNTQLLGIKSEIDAGRFIEASSLSGSLHQNLSNLGYAQEFLGTLAGHTLIAADQVQPGTMTPDGEIAAVEPCPDCGECGRKVLVYADGDHVSVRGDTQLLVKT